MTVQTANKTMVTTHNYFSPALRAGYRQRLGMRTVLCAPCTHARYAAGYARYRFAPPAVINVPPLRGSI